MIVLSRSNTNNVFYTFGFKDITCIQRQHIRVPMSNYVLVITEFSKNLHTWLITNSELAGFG